MTVTHPALDPARPLVFVDIETTGGSAMTSRILEVAALKMERGKVTNTYSTLIDPDEVIPPFITQLTGITESDVDGSPFFNQIAWELYNFLDGAVFVAHNVDFDLSFIREEYRRLGADFTPDKLCTVQLSRHFYPHFATHKLGALIERHELEVADRHRAHADAKAIADFYLLVDKEFGHTALMEARAALLKSPPPRKRSARVAKPAGVSSRLIIPGD